jgi:hypothetical protein
LLEDIEQSLSLGGRNGELGIRQLVEEKLVSEVQSEQAERYRRQNGQKEKADEGRTDDGDTSGLVAGPEQGPQSACVLGLEQDIQSRLPRFHL